MRSSHSINYYDNDYTKIRKELYVPVMAINILAR